MIELDFSNGLSDRVDCCSEFLLATFRSKFMSPMCLQLGPPLGLVTCLRNLLDAHARCIVLLRAPMQLKRTQQRGVFQVNDQGWKFVSVLLWEVVCFICCC